MAGRRTRRTVEEQEEHKFFKWQYRSKFKWQIFVFWHRYCHTTVQLLIHPTTPATTPTNPLFLLQTSTPTIKFPHFILPKPPTTSSSTKIPHAQDHFLSTLKAIRCLYEESVDENASDELIIKQRREMKKNAAKLFPMVSLILLILFTAYSCLLCVFVCGCVVCCFFCWRNWDGLAGYKCRLRWSEWTKNLYLYIRIFKACLTPSYLFFNM